MPIWERHILRERATRFLPALISNPEAWPRDNEVVPDAAHLPGSDYAMVDMSEVEHGE